MGGRGASMGSKGAAPSAPKVSKPTLSKTPLKKMSDSQLKNELLKMTTYYYASGKSGISFGGRDPVEVAKTMVNQRRSRTSMEKDYRALKRALK